MVAAPPTEVGNPEGEATRKNGGLGGGPFPHGGSGWRSPQKIEGDWGGGRHPRKVFVVRHARKVAKQMCGHRVGPVIFLAFALGLRLDHDTGSQPSGYGVQQGTSPVSFICFVLAGQVSLLLDPQTAPDRAS